MDFMACRFWASPIGFVNKDDNIIHGLGGFVYSQNCEGLHLHKTGQRFTHSSQNGAVPGYPGCTAQQ